MGADLSTRIAEGRVFVEIVGGHSLSGGRIDVVGPSDGKGGGIELPFGGFKAATTAARKRFEALYDMSVTKTIVFNHG